MLILPFAALYVASFLNPLTLFARVNLIPIALPVRNREWSTELSAGEESVVKVYSQCMDTKALEEVGLTHWKQLLQVCYCSIVLRTLWIMQEV